MLPVACCRLKSDLTLHYNSQPIVITYLSQFFCCLYKNLDSKKKKISVFLEMAVRLGWFQNRSDKASSTSCIIFLWQELFLFGYAPYPHGGGHHITP